MSLRGLLAVAREPVDAASVGVFRIVFAVIMFAEISRFFIHGWIGEHYLTPPFLFKYYGFEWVAPWPGATLYWHFAILGLLAAMVGLGMFYRVAAIGLFFGFAYVFLLEQASYLNQYYLLLSIALLLCFVPADRAYSLRALRKENAVPPVVPRWSVWILRLQLELMLIYAGLVKINADWLGGQPLGMWFADTASALPVLAWWLNTPGLNVAAAYGVVLLHVVGAPLLLWQRTRYAVFLLYVGFHLANSTLFHIGVFPWITLAGTLLFFDPSWPRQIAQRLGMNRLAGIPVYTGATRCATRLHAPVVVLLAVFFTLQILAPLRYLVYPGNVAWSHEGQWFAWRMKLDDKRASALFIVTDSSSARRWEVDPNDYLQPRQVMLMATNPDMLLQFAHYLEALWRARDSIADVEVRAVVTCALNGRAPALLIDPHTDLSRISRTWRHYNWILPQPAEPVRSSYALR